MKNSLFYLKASLQTLKSPRTITVSAMLIALNVILTRFLSYDSQFLRIGFGFLPIAMTAMLFGPIPGAFAAALGEIIGFFLFPKGMYFPGFTISAFIYGLIYGVFLYRKEITVKQIITSCFMVILISDVCLNSLWLSILYNSPIQIFILGRIIKSAIMLIIQPTLIYLFDILIIARIKQFLPVGAYNENYTD